MSLRTIPKHFMQMDVVRHMGTFVYLPDQDEIVLLVNKAETERVTPQDMSNITNEALYEATTTSSHPYLGGVLVSILCLAAACIIGHLLESIPNITALSYISFLALSGLCGIELGVVWRGWTEDHLRYAMENAEEENFVVVQSISKKLRRRLIRKQVADSISCVFFILLAIAFFQLPDALFAPLKMSIELLPPSPSTALCAAFVSFATTIAIVRGPIRSKHRCIKKLRRTEILKDELPKE